MTWRPSNLGLGLLLLALSGQSASDSDQCLRCHFDPRLISRNDIGEAFVHLRDREDESAEGLWCRDCHTSIQLNEHGAVVGTNPSQTEIRCEDCHGNLAQLPWELPLEVTGLTGAAQRPGKPRGLLNGDGSPVETQHPGHRGYLLTSRGNPFGNVFREGERVYLESVSGRRHEVTLLADLAEHRSWRSERSKEVKSAPHLHKEMSCMDCHADWLPPCLGCHGQTDSQSESPDW